LKEFLKDKRGRQDGFAAFDGANQCANFRSLRGNIAAVRERPNAGIDEEAQSRERSFL
jgi:hypothetical protein